MFQKDTDIEPNYLKKYNKIYCVFNHVIFTLNILYSSIKLI